MSLAILRNNLLLENYIINILIAFIPISFIAGNLILNLNVVLLILFSLIFYKSNIFLYKFNLIDKIILLAFISCLFSGLINGFQIFQIETSNYDFNVIKKTIVFFRYLLFYFVVRYLVLNKKLNFKLFFLSCFTCSIFVSLDIIYQFIFGFDIFGFKADTHKLSGPFGDELIAGSYLQRFGIFSLFYLPIFFNIRNKNYIFLFLTLIFFLVLFSIIVSGNRMPFILFLMIVGMIFLFEKKSRKYFFIFFILSSTIFLIIYNKNETTKNYFNHFLKTAIDIKTSSQRIFSINLSDSDKKLFNEDPQIFLTNTYVKEFYSGFAAWQQGKFIGGGINSFYSNCTIKVNDCASHPHNYYLEILSELGIAGLILFLTIFLLILHRTFYLKYFKEKNFNIIIIPFMYLFLAEIFPIKTSGSFFTTGNATFIFFIMAVTVALSKRSN